MCDLRCVTTCLPTVTKDGQEAKELPQGGSLRDNVDTSVALKRKFTVCGSEVTITSDYFVFTPPVCVASRSF